VRRLAVLLLGLALAGPALAQDCVDTGSPDCDGDGFVPPEDCDDDDPDVNPDADEVCNNGVDDDCDDVVDDDCYERFQDGRLEGGSTCEGNGDGWAGLVLLPLWWRRRRS